VCNWKRGIFSGGKGGLHVGLKTYHLNVPIVLKSGSLNLLEPTGPVQVAQGLLHLLLPVYNCKWQL
jgi:hypothetical protein